MRFLNRWLSPNYSVLLTLCSLFIFIPLISRGLLGWSQPYGYLSDIAVGSLLTVLLYQRTLLIALPLMIFWSILTLANVELISAVGRMPEVTDLHYLTDTQFVSRSTHGAGLSHPLLAFALLINIALYLLLLLRQQPAARQPLAGTWVLAPLTLLAAHAVLQYRAPSESDQWFQFNLPHKLAAEGLSNGEQDLQSWMSNQPPGAPVDIAGLQQLDLDGTPLLRQAGRARNVLIITLEGIPGAYLSPSRDALRSPYDGNTMPRLSHWAEQGMLTADYVLHSHQTIRGLYSMLCGDYAKLDSGTPKGVELLNNPDRSQQCLPAQMRQNGFSTHYLQGAGLRFMAKDQIMPQMGFDKTLGRDWFSNAPHLKFPWGMDDKGFFEGSLSYINELRQQEKPWMLTLMTVGTHQPYSAPADYLQRFPDSKLAAVAYLDDAVGDFLDALEKQGLLKDTLVIVTSDESHGIENLSLASAWGFNLILAPEQQQLPRLKQGIYGHVDLTASVLDYFALPVPNNISGRSLLRDYSHGRQIISYTNGLLREHDGKGLFTECDFQHVCRRYASPGFINDKSHYLGRFTGKAARLLSQQAERLNQSLRGANPSQRYQFANHQPIELKPQRTDDWADNLVGAQYLELPENTQTTVTMKIRAVNLDAAGATLQLKTKEYDRDVKIAIPPLPTLTADQPVSVSFTFNNLDTRKAFSFHLLGQGNGAITLDDFSVTTTPRTDSMVAAQSETPAAETPDEEASEDLHN
ncbi:LTA synthase family protein [Pseudomonas sp. NPDC078700]|uniref:LTA synthase family protein n=1 Tax=Pseudomonas sp. NPDC078700 TaxID=3364424 RepID=UPI0037C7F369